VVVFVGEPPQVHTHTYTPTGRGVFVGEPPQVHTHTYTPTRRGVFVGEPPQVQPAASELCPLSRRAVQLSHGGVQRDISHSLLVHHIRRLT